MLSVIQRLLWYRGMAAQYPIAAIVGKVIDRYGAWSCSLVASLLFSLGFGLFAREVATNPTGTHASAASFNVLVLCFAMLGLATVCSYVLAHGLRE